MDRYEETNWKSIWGEKKKAGGMPPRKKCKVDNSGREKEDDEWESSTMTKMPETAEKGQGNKQRIKVYQ